MLGLRSGSEMITPCSTHDALTGLPGSVATGGLTHSVRSTSDGGAAHPEVERMISPACMPIPPPPNISSLIQPVSVAGVKPGVAQSAGRSVSAMVLLMSGGGGRLSYSPRVGPLASTVG